MVCSGERAHSEEWCAVVQHSLQSLGWKGLPVLLSLSHWPASPHYGLSHHCTPFLTMGSLTTAHHSSLWALSPLHTIPHYGLSHHCTTRSNSFTFSPLSDDFVP